MNKLLKSLLIFVITLALTACAKNEVPTASTPPPSTNTTTTSSYPCDNVYTTRVGAVCNDGSSSTATGSGACSSHGGVKYWLCK